MLRIDVSAVGGVGPCELFGPTLTSSCTPRRCQSGRAGSSGSSEWSNSPIDRGFWYADDKSYLLLSVPLVAVNGLLHHRLRRNQTVTWRWLLFLSAMDIALITAAVIIGGEFHLFSYVAYYPALALFAVVFTSLPLSLAWTTVVAIVYAGVSLTVGSGLDFDAGQEKALLARLMAM